MTTNSNQFPAELRSLLALKPKLGTELMDVGRETRVKKWLNTCVSTSCSDIQSDIAINLYHSIRR